MTGATRDFAAPVGAALLAMALCVHFAVAAPRDDLLPFLVQSACLDSAGAVVPGRLPFEPACDRRRPLSVGEPLPYRKHDWPAEAHAAIVPLGYQASDSLLGTLLGRPAVLQTFDFGDPQPGARAFGRFDAGRGDGAQAVLIGPDGSAGVTATEDATGLTWFRSDACTAGGDPFEPGWLLAAPPLAAEWRERVVALWGTPKLRDCPAAFSRSLTRWRLDRLAWPVGDPGASGAALGIADLDTIVTEHFGRDVIARAENLERMFLARDLGLVRWERWEDRATSRLHDMDALARLTATARACPPVAHSVPPAPGWVMVMCRTWTSFVRAATRDAMTTPDPWPTLAVRPR